MGLLDDIIGALLLATWTNTALMAYEIALAVRYFKEYPKDPSLTRLAVTVLLLFDSLTCAFEYILVYMYSVTHWGDQTFLLASPWPLSAYALTTEWSAYVVQLYLIHRFFKLSRNWIIASFLAACSTAGVAANVWIAYGLVVYTTITERTLLHTPAVFWYSSVVGADILIALALAWCLQSMRRSAFKSTDRMIVRLIYGVISTGSLTAAAALLNMILYLAYPTTNWGPFICFNIGRIYTLTMLFNLTHRGANSINGGSREKPQVHSTSTGAMHLDTMTGSNHGSTAIKIHRVVHVDDPNGDSPDYQKSNTGSVADEISEEYKSDRKDAGRAV